MTKMFVHNPTLVILQDETFRGKKPLPEVFIVPADVGPEARKTDVVYHFEGRLHRVDDVPSAVREALSRDE